MARKGETLSLEYRAAVSAGLRRYETTPEHGAAISKGQQQSARLRQSRRRHYGSPLLHGRGICAHFGRPVSEETRIKIAEASRVSWGKRTWMEEALALLLNEAGLDFEEQHRFGRCVVDAWVTSHQLVFEADASFWHQDKVREARRDEYLLIHGVLAVIHLTEGDLRPCQRLS